MSITGISPDPQDLDSKTKLVHAFTHTETVPPKAILLKMERKVKMFLTLIASLLLTILALSLYIALSKFSVYHC